MDLNLIISTYGNELYIFDPRINQQEAFGWLQTGIHCQATGCGKSFIIIR
jgi:hypothetical protein